MKSWPLMDLLKVLLRGKISLFFLAGVILSFAFSMAVILTTIGIMDGFKQNLKQALKSTNGDLILSYRPGFFEFNQDLEKIMLDRGLESYTQILQAEAFAVHDEQASGVAVRGVDGTFFKKHHALGAQLGPMEALVGEVLLEKLGLKLGQEFVIILGSGSEGVGGLPIPVRFKVKGLIDHGIYDKNLRFLYVRLDDLQRLMNRPGKINLMFLNVAPNPAMELETQILGLKSQLQMDLGSLYQLRPFWREFSGLLEAVEIEKVSISLILQIIVLISIFNIYALIFFIQEKRSRDLFLLRAIGLSQKRQQMLWVVFVLGLWAICCGVSWLMAWGLNHFFLNSKWLSLPGEVYNLTHLELALRPVDYLLVYSGALLWMVVIFLLGLWRAQAKSLISGLRKEFG